VRLSFLYVHPFLRIKIGQFSGGGVGRVHAVFSAFDHIPLRFSYRDGFPSEIIEESPLLSILGFVMGSLGLANGVGV